jgi:tetratricopeptide (TPR) repeat protein
MRLPVLVAALCVLAACAPPAQVSKSGPTTETGVGFGSLSAGAARPAGLAGSTLARDFMDLTFAMESGRGLEVFSRFEGPITVAMSGAAPQTAARDLAALIARLQGEAGIDIRAAGGGPASITVEFASRGTLRRLAPQAACFVVPNVSSLAEYRRLRGSAAVDWAQVTRRDRAAIFIPDDTSPQEMRDCLHEELAQAIGPLNDLYRLSDSVFNDDNFHSVLTGFDMQILRLTYSPRIASGMTRDEVARALFGGAGLAGVAPPGAWVQSIELALGRSGSLAARQDAAARALALAERQGWRDARLGFSHFAVGRLMAAGDPGQAIRQFQAAAAVYARLPGAEVHLAHVDMQLAAIALATGRPEEAMRYCDRAIPVVRRHENPALLATLLLIKAEAADRLGDAATAAALRLDSQAHARYGFGPENVVRARMRDIAAVADRAENG